jgi:FkbM family methyltransferase
MNLLWGRSAPSKLYNLSKKAALSLLYKLPPFPQNLHGRLVWIHPRARFSITTQTFFKGEFHVRTWLKEQLKPGHVFFDVGAHHGWDSMWTLPLIGKEGKVVSFEPSPANLSILEWHRTRNNFSQWVIVPKAISDVDAEGEEFFLIDTGDSPMNSLTTGGPGTPFMGGRDIRKIYVPTITLDTFCSEMRLRPNLVKIDVEGAELLVLRGAGKLLSESCPTIILAVHPHWLPAGQSTQQIFESLTEDGYRMYDSKGSLVEYIQEGEYLCLNPGVESTPI